jgi:hypothetical protein
MYVRCVLVVILSCSSTPLIAQRLSAGYSRVALVDLLPSPTSSHVAAVAISTSSRPKAAWFALGGALVGAVVGALTLGPSIVKAEVGPEGFCYGLGAGLGGLLGAAVGLTVHSFKYPPEPPQ